MSFSNISFSGSGLGSGGEMEDGGTNNTGFSLYWPCRYSPISKNSTSPFVWQIPPQLQHTRPYVGTAEGVLFIVGFLWNLFVLMSYCFKPRLLKEPANIYLFNLALIDILLTIFITLASVISEATGEFIFGDSDFVRCHYCEFLGVVLHTFISLSLHTITALSVDRLILLSQPVNYKSIFNWKRALILQVALWVISFAISIPPVLGFGEYEYNTVLASCQARWTGQGSRGIENIYFVAFFGAEALIPIIILTITNVCVVKIVKKFLRQRIGRQRTYRGSSSSRKLNEEKTYQKQQNQLVKVFGALFIAHILCWTPVLTVMFVALGIGASNIPLEVFIVAWLLYLTIPVIHPILESFFIKDLRHILNKTKKSMGTSIGRASSNLYSQMSTSSLMRSFSRSSRLSTSSDIRKPSIQRTVTDTLPNAAMSPLPGAEITNQITNNEIINQKERSSAKKPLRSRVSFSLVLKEDFPVRPHSNTDPCLAEMGPDDVFSPGISTPDQGGIAAGMHTELYNIAEH